LGDGNKDFSSKGTEKVSRGIAIAIFDGVNSRYELMQFGWDRERRVLSNLIYVTHVTQKSKKVSETAIPSKIAAKP